MRWDFTMGTSKKLKVVAAMSPHPNRRAYPLSRPAVRKIATEI
jgi:hypothetical protein